MILQTNDPPPPIRHLSGAIANRWVSGRHMQMMTESIISAHLHLHKGAAACRPCLDAHDLKVEIWLVDGGEIPRNARITTRLSFSAIMANPRKFSEKIALHNQKQAEETAAFEAILREVSVTTRVSKLVARWSAYAQIYRRFWHLKSWIFFTIIYCLVMLLAFPSADFLLEEATSQGKPISIYALSWCQINGSEYMCNGAFSVARSVHACTLLDHRFSAANALAFWTA